MGGKVDDSKSMGKEYSATLPRRPSLLTTHATNAIHYCFNYMLTTLKCLIQMSIPMKYKISDYAYGGKPGEI